MTILPLVAAVLVATQAQAQAPGPAPTLRWVEGPAGLAVEVVGLDTDSLDRVGPGIASIRLARPDGEPEAASLPCRFERVGPVVRFRPAYPPLPGSRYLARLDLRSVGLGRIEAVHLAERRPEAPPVVVRAVYPTADVLPENLLKFYVQFSGPMSRGDAYRHVRIVDGAGRAIDRPFLEIGEELWSPDATRLTLLLDPGRIKRGLVPRREEGPILEEGRSYTLTIDADWPDADARPLASSYRKGFRADPPDDRQPDPTTWTHEVPPAGGRAPLVVRFPEPLDRAMLARAIAVEAAGSAIPGAVEVGDGERSWRFVPDRDWPTGPITLRVDPELEDLAGNSIARPFEVDDVRPRADVKPVGPVRVVLPSPR